MKNLLNFKRLWTDSHEKQKVRSMRRGAAVLLLLFACVTHALAEYEYGKYNLYLDISNNTGWKAADGYIGFHFSYNENSNGEYIGRYKATQVEGNIYCVSASTHDNAYIRGIKAARWATSDDGNTDNNWNIASNIHPASSSSHSSKNKIIIPSNGWSDCTTTWGLYVPTVSSVSFTYDVVPSSGAGTSVNPYKVPTGTTVRVTAAPTSVIEDSQCTLKYNWDNAGYGTTKYKDLSCSVAGNTYSTTVVVANEINSTKGTTATATIYFQAVSTPTITMTSVTPSTSIVAGNDITLVGTRANSSNAISFQYTTNDGSTWTDISPKTSSTDGNVTTATWTVPDAHGANQTFKFRAKLAEASPIYSSKSDGVTVYNTKTIHVKNTNNWSTLYVYAWDGSGDITNSWAGNTGNTNTGGFTCTNIGGGLWWDVVITSRATNFIINCNSTGDANQTADLSYGTYTHNNCYAIGTNSGKRTLSGTTVSCLTDASVSTTAAASILRTSATLGGSVSGNGNDKIISYGYYYTTNSDLSSSNVIGTRVEVGTDNKSGSYTKSQTGLSANTTYYVMAYAKNGNGEAYGSVVSFTTLAQYTVTTGVVDGQTARGSVSPASVTCSSAEWSANVSASANPGYIFNSWTTSDGITKAGATSPTQVKATKAGTIKASFNEVMRTVSVVSGNTNFGNVSTASLTSVGPETKSAEVTATPETGATFTRWDVVSGITIADGYTNTSNPVKINATAASKTLTAVFTETKHTVTLTTADAEKGTVGSNQSVGQITAVQITATPKSGYMFSKWVKTAGSGTVTYYTGAGTGQVTDASGDEKETTYVCVTGDVTLQATWEPDRSSGFVVHYGNNGYDSDGNSAPSQARAWKDGKLYRATTEESNVSYFTFTAGVGDVDKVIYFKIWDLGSTWYGYNSGDGGKITGDVTNATLNTSYGDARMCIIMPGSYKFTWNKSTKQLSVAYPDDVYYVRGGFNSWDWSHPMTETSSGVYSATINMTEANHTYSGDNGFKVLIAGQYYGKNSTTVTRYNSTGSADYSPCAIGESNIGLTTDYTGNYTFTYMVSTNTLRVTYPTAYKVTYGKGSVDGSASACSAVDITNGGTAVTSNSTWVKSGNQVVLTAPSAKSGYRYLGWFANNAGTGDAITTNANCTITVSSALTRYACYAENLTAITITTDGHGTITAPSPNSSPYNLGVTTTQAINASANTGYSWSTWTTSGNAALGITATTASNTAKGNGTNGGTGTITATFTPNHYNVILDVNGGSGDNQTVDATFDAAMPTTQKGGSTPIAARTKTGYNFDGYWANNTGTGTQYYTSALTSNHIWDVATNETHIYAKWNPKQSAITFDYQTGVTGYSSSGNITNASGLKGTYDAAMTALTGTMPSAIEGYAFTGFYDATSGGTKYYNADGTSAHVWDKDTDSGTTLYARWERAQITALTPDAAQVEPETTVGVTPTISPTPTPTTTICWYVLYGNGNKLSPQPTDMAYSEGKLTFTAPATSGLYKVAAELRTGSSCGGGTLLDTDTIDFYVAGSHIVTIDYKYSGTNIAASTNVTGYPLEWSEDITAPDVFGYTFSSWSAGAGVTIKDSEHEDVTTSTETTIKIKAIYEGTLTANYTPKSLIYFKNTLGWSSVYVNFYKSGYWNDSKGSGNNNVPVQNKTMTRLGETDIWYYDYGSDDFTGYTGTKPTNYVSFTSDTQSSAENFWASGTGISVSYPARRSDDLADKANETGFYEATPMFVPLEGQTPITKNESAGGKALYYNSGYWTKYLPGTGYTLEFYDNGTGAFLKSMDFTSADELMPMQAVVDLEANTTYKFQIKRHGDVYLGNSGTMTYTEHGQSTPWEMTATDFSMCRITTTAAGDYTFHFTYSANSSYEYRMRVAVDYPVSDGDYRLVYTDDTRSGRIKPSAIVQKENDGTAIVSFFVRKDEHPVLRIQQASVDGSGNITWNEYPTSGTPTNQITGTIASAITTDTVYNFNLSMNGSGALSVASAEFYSGNYYIRTDAANSKWDNYRTDPDHVMTTSEYLKSSVGYTHYYCHWVNKDETGRKNVKFVIANDYSPCISDTLARETASGTWANIDTWMEEGGDLKRSANVRFMWDAETNNIARAYVDGAQGAGSDNFLIMLSGDSKIKNEAKTETLTQVYFADNQNWIYEANINAQPNAQIKLISNWGTGVKAITQYFKGASDATVALIGGSGETWYKIRLLYDFKTNRLVAAYIPSGTISTATPINADVMFIRSGQGDIEQLTFSGSGDITEITSAYGVLRLNKWTLNNKNTEDPHNPLPVDEQLSIFERSLYWISFPFRVKLNDVFGFGTYGVHWAIQRYDGAARAAQGHFLENGSFWRWMDRNSEYLEPNQGYLLSIDLDLLGESSDVWGPNSLSERIELYFPSEGSLAKITSSTITQEIPAHECTINRAATEGLPDTGNPATSYNRTIFDSHWNVLSVPTYINTTAVEFANTTWTSAHPSFFYTWNSTDNTITAMDADGYEYHAMHSYMVQYAGDITWTASVTEPSIVARKTYEEAPSKIKFRLELQQNDKMLDRTYIVMSNDEEVSANFAFGEDMTKEFNKNKAAIFNYTADHVGVAGNTMPMSEQTTVIPLGLEIPKAGEYTFAIPDGTEGVGVTLIDNETGTRTSLSALDYTVNLTTGTHDGRFVLEISPVHGSTTGIETVGGEPAEESGARKMIIDQKLFIIKGDKMYDARGAMVK